jgi:c-di-GMP-binding flagellar brake protein YcgR
MILLATMNYKLIATGDSRTMLYFGIAIGVVIILIVVGALVNRRRRPLSPDEVQKVSGAAFRRAGRSVGLPPQHVQALEELVRITKVKQPFLVFTSAGLLDDVLKKGLYSIEAARDVAPEEKERRKGVLFQVKQIIEKNARKGAVLRSSTMLKPGQLLTVTPGGGGHFASKVVSNMKDFLTISAPAGAAGTEMRWMRGTPLAVYFWRENDAGYTFPSKVLGYDTVKGLSCVLIQHSKTLRREQRRKARRREIMRACFYYPIRIVETGSGRKTERKASVDQGLRTLGTVVDLSAGGCAIQTLSPFERGKLVMVEFDIDRRAPIRAFGKVMGVARRKGRGGIMHVMFTSVTRQHLNRICSFVYDFSLPAEVRQPAAPRAVTVRPR